MTFQLSIKGICILIAILLGFLFPAYLIDALKLTDDEKAREARGKACVSFGFLVVFFILLMNS